MSSQIEQPEAGRGRALGELAAVFLRLGTTAFGGPAAHVAMMEDEFVRRRRWLTHERFLDLLAAVNLLPGPNSTEMAIYVGYLRAGWLGLVLAGVCFILPAMLLVTAIAWAYVQFGSLPQFAGLLYGVKPVVIAIIVQALAGLAPKAVKSRPLGLLAVLVVAGSLLGGDPTSLLLGAGLVVGLGRGLARDRAQNMKAVLVMLAVVAGILAVVHLVPRLSATAEPEFGLWPLFLCFLKVGSVLYGSGYVLAAFLQGDLVDRWHWLKPDQLLDAIAVGQVTPGPLFTTATFIGYYKAELAGCNPLAGAVVATVGIFLPSFVLIALSGPLIPRLRKSAIAAAFLDGVTVAAVALMAVVAWQLGVAAIVDLSTAILAAVSLLVLVRFRVNTAWLVLGGAVAGLALR